MISPLGVLNYNYFCWNKFKIRMMRH